MAYIGFMSMGGTRSAGVAGTKQKLVANTIGGLATFVFYFVMIAVPEFYFFVVLMLLPVGTASNTTGV